MSDVSSRLAALTPAERTRLLNTLKRERRDGGPVPVTAADRGRPLPLSYAQWRLWFLHRLEGPSASYNMPAAFRLSGALDRAALAAALDGVVRRHEVLRTRIVEVDGEPVQTIDPPDAQIVALPLAELEAGPRSDREEALRRLLHDEAARPFDLTADHPFRALLVHLADDEHVLAITMHHVASDGWSTGVLLRECSTLYNAIRAGSPPALPDLPVQYADFAAWQRKTIEADAAKTAAEVEYWRQQLDGAPRIVNLPADGPRGSAPARGGSVEFHLDAGIAERVAALAQSANASAYMVMLAAFVALVHRWSGDSDITVGSPIANRPRKELEGLIGFFVNTLALRVGVDGDPGFRALLARVRDVALGAYAHADLPFEQLVERLNPDRRLGESPFFNVMLAMQSGVVDESALDGLRIAVVPVSTGAARLDLVLSLQEAADGIAGSLEFSESIFRADTAQRFTEHFRNLLTAAVREPETPVSRLELLGRGERHRVLVEWNRTEVAFPRGLCLHQLIDEQAAKTPDAVAVRARGTTWTYAELVDQSSRVVRLLHDRGVGPDTLVGICMDRSAGMIAALLGVLRAGGAYVALDPAYPAARLEYVLADSGASIVLTSRNAADAVRLVPGSRDVIVLDEPGVPDLSRSSVHRDAPRPAVSPSHLAYVLYTSGSTGRPKGVAIEHRSPVALIQWARTVWPLDELRGVLAGTSICFDLSVFEIFLPLSAGGTVILADTVLDLPALDAKDDVTLVNTVPSAIDALLTQNALPSGVRVVNLAGEPLTTELADRVYGVPSVTKVYDLYGPSEDTTYSTAALRRRGDPPSIGRPIANTRLYILDRAMQPMPAGLPGEIYLGGDGLARGYLGRPDLTAERFVPSPFVAGDRLYRTGDLGRFRADGHVEFLGRIDHQVKIRGFRIELGEIEAVLRECAGVTNGVAVVQEAGAGNSRIVAYAAHAGGQLVAPALLEHLRSRLPEYMVPPVLVVLERLPLTPNGKVDRAALPAPAARGARTPSRPLSAHERRLAAIWTRLLAHEHVAADDDFFSLGGHSLLAARLASKIRDEFAVDIPLRALFEHSTLRAQAAAIAARQGAAPADARPAPMPGPRDRLPLSFAQERLWFLDQLEPGSAAYNMAGAIRLTGDVDVDALRGAFARVIERHEVLRTVFPAIGGEACAVPCAMPPAFDVRDVRTLADPDREARIRAILGDEGQRPFDLATGPLIRATAVRAGDRDLVLSVAMHHIVSDGWSIDLLLSELAAPATDPRRLQYADFAAWQRERFESGAMAPQLEYWRTALEGAPAVLDLPIDRPRQESQRYRGASVTSVIDAPLAALLARRDAAAGVTPFMTLLTAFAIVLDRWSSTHDIVIGVPAAGRSGSELETLIGLFVNTVPIRVRPSAEMTLGDVLARVRTRVIDALANQDVPFEKLVDTLGVTRTLSWSPLFQVMFVMQPPRTAPSLPAGIHAEPLPPPDTETTKFDLTLAVAGEGDELTATFEYDRDLFDRATIEAVAADFTFVLRGVLNTPESTLQSLARPASISEHAARLPVTSATPALSIAPAATEESAPIERALTEIWRQVLGLDDVQPADNFFELGGDSIVSIRMIAKLRERGWQIRPKDVFRHQTIRSLAAVARPVAAQAIAAEPISELPLTPMQRVFFSLHPPSPNHFNQALLLNVDESVATEDLRDALREVQRVHPALNSRFRSDDDATWRQMVAPGTDVAFEAHDLSAEPAAGRTMRMERLCGDAQRRLSISEGPVFRAVLFRLGGSARLLLVAHHLVVDAVSWHVILEDLETAHAQMRSGQRPALPPESANAAALRLLIDRRAAHPDVAFAGRVLDALQREPASPPRPTTVRTMLSESETRTLITTAHRAGGAGVDDLLLAALGRELCAIAGRDVVVVDVEGHGRNAEDLDLSRTVGWLTALQAVALPCAASAGHDALIGAVRAATRIESAATIRPTDVSFNYLGQADARTGGGFLAGIAPESPGAMAAADLPRLHRLECNAAVIHGRLAIEYRFDAAALDRQAVADLADRALATLRALIDHTAAAVTTDDEEDEARYALSPSQTGMWLQSAAQAAPDRFIEQAAICLEGALDVPALTRALDLVVSRHGALRSVIVDSGSAPVRAVRRRMAVHIEPYDLHEHDEETALTRVMAGERQRAFRLDAGPLIRFALLGAESARAWLVLSFHHIILDGWSLPILWAEADAAYAAEATGGRAALAPPPREADMAAWLSAQAPALAEEFWRARLRGFSTPTPLASPSREAPPQDAEELERFLTREAGAAIRHAARASRVSPATVMELLWAMVIAGRTGTTDVVFGATVSGRPAEVPGIDRMIGFFINTVPIRVEFDGGVSFREALVQHQQRRAEQAEFEYCSSGQIHGWSAVTAPDQLFDSLLVFENVGGPAVERDADRSVTIRGQRVRGARTAYPLTLLVSPGDRPHLRFIAQPSRLSSAAVREIAAALEQLAARCAHALDRPVAEWLGTIAFAGRHERPEMPRSRVPYVAPRSRLEHGIAAIWEQLFQRSRIGVLDDFFALGGHSLVAVQMAAELRSQLGIELPLHAVIVHSTIERLALACKEARDESEGLIPLTVGGAGLPVFCIHPLGGHVLCYAALGRRLAGDHSCWGLQAKGLGKDDRPAETWDAIVEHHWTLLRQARADLDDLALVGYSYGGYIAIELAARAYREGARGVRLVLLDVPHPSVIPAGSRDADAATLLHALFGTALALDLSELQAVPDDEVLRFVYDRSVAGHVLPPGADLAQLERALRVAQAHSRLLPPPAWYDFPVSLLRARDGASRVSSLPDLGWTPHVRDVSVIWVDGSHETMLDSPHVDGIAAVIAQCLRAPVAL